MSVESTNIKVMEHNKEVLLLEKASLGKYLVVKGTAEKMLDHLLESELEMGSQEGMTTAWDINPKTGTDCSYCRATRTQWY